MVLVKIKRCETCTKKLRLEWQRNRLKDPGIRSKLNADSRNYNRKKKDDLTYKNKVNKKSRENYKKRMKDPEYRQQQNAKVVIRRKMQKLNPDFDRVYKQKQAKWQRRSDIKKNKQVLLALRLKLGKNDSL